MKAFQFILALFLFSTIIKAQCVPDTTLIGSSFYFAPPNSQYTNINGINYAILPYAETGVAYDAVLQFKIPADTTVNSLTATIDHLKVLSITNLPASFQLTCNPTDCIFPGGSFGCVQMAGIGGPADSILLKVVIELKFSNGGSTFSAVDTIKDIVLVTKGFIGLEESFNNLNFQSYPNPIHDKLSLSFNAIDLDTEVQIISLDGKTVFEKKYISEIGKNGLELNLSDLSNGVYQLSLVNGKQSIQRKISILH